VLFLFTYLVAVLIGFAILGMALWHTWLIATGQTTIEHHINSYKKAEARYSGQPFTNEFDLGTVRNFQEFFNIGAHRYQSLISHWITVFIPMRVSPRTDGRSYTTVQHLFREPQFYL
jgi:palmitoyltransferase